MKRLKIKALEQTIIVSTKIAIIIDDNMGQDRRNEFEISYSFPMLIVAFLK